MLTEVALTPHIFQPCSIDPDRWADQLRALNQRLTHFGGLCPLIFSNLNRQSPRRTADWRADVARLVVGAKGPHATRLRDLLQLIDLHIVIRPSYGHVHNVAIEDQWVKEAIAPAPMHPIQQIVTSWQGVTACRRIYTKACGLNDLEGDSAFWASALTSAYPPMNIADQVELLRPLLLHGRLLSVVLPYAIEPQNSGRPHGEASWFFAVAAKAFSRPSGYGVPEIHLHVSFDGHYPTMQAQAAAHPAVVEFIQIAKRQAVLRGKSFKLFVRMRTNGGQRYISRRLFAGDLADVGTGTPVPRVRWGVALEHVAHPTDAPNQTTPTFTLLPRHQAETQFRSECDNPAVRLVVPIPVQC